MMLTDQGLQDDSIRVKCGGVLDLERERKVCGTVSTESVIRVFPVSRHVLTVGCGWVVRT